MAKSNINLGKVLITLRGAWSAEEEYKHLDVVYTLDGSYIAKADNKGVSPDDTNTWQLIAGRGPAGTGNVSAIESGLEVGKKYLFVPSSNHKAEGHFVEYDPQGATQIQADWDQSITDKPDYIRNKPELFSGDYADLINKPDLFSGNYIDLEGKPDLFSGDYNDLENKPTLFSGSYSDLTDQPTIPEKLSDLENDTHFISETEAGQRFQEKVEGGGLSTNDYTNAEKEKLAGIEEGAQRNSIPLHKTVTLEVSDWIQNEELWEIDITDTDLTSDCVITAWPVDKQSNDIASTAKSLPDMPVSISESTNHFTIKAENIPTGEITINYTIQY